MPTLLESPPLKCYELLEAACLPLIEAFKEDLVVHDRRDIASAGDACPFLHWTRNTGTTIVFLPPPFGVRPGGEPFWPRIGERIKYLFGTADRWHILDQVVPMAKYHTKPSNEPHKYTAHHWDGSKLRRITVEAAVTLAMDYKDSVSRAWRRDNEDHRRDAWL